MKAVVLGAMMAAVLAGPASAEARVERGKYLAAIMDCAGCHTPGVFLGKPDFSRMLGGSEVGFQIPGLGIFYPPNLTPDTDSGLGSWSEDEIIAAVRTGARPDGRVLAPAMPWRSYAALSDSDAKALAAYLKSLPAVKNKVPAMTGPSEKAPGPYLGVIMP
jgi:mono/diheme cytochrome c family protein